MSGWTNVTVVPKDDCPPEASSRQRDPAERLYESLAREFGEDAMFPRNPTTFRAPIRHWGDPPNPYSSDPNDAPEEIKELVEEFPLIGDVLVIYTDDTGDEGIGWYYDVTEDGVECVDEFAGYQGAMGRDVVGYFEDEYRVGGTAQR
jgi:hypothetical protein